MLVMNIRYKICDRYNYIDLLLYNIKYKCYVVVELKVTELKKEHTGQIMTYMNYIDKNIKTIEENDTVGIIICKQDNEYVIKYCSDEIIIAREYELVWYNSIGDSNLKKINYNDKLYFVSEKSIKDNILFPRIPDNYFTQNGYEDNINKRVCFCKTIEKCLMALSKNCKDLVFYVYEVDDATKYQVYEPDVSEVPDSIITEELWILSPVKLKFICKVKCTNSVENDGHIFKYGGKTAKLYEWKYEII